MVLIITEFYKKENKNETKIFNPKNCQPNAVIKLLCFLKLPRSRVVLKNQSKGGGVFLNILRNILVLTIRSNINYYNHQTHIN